MIIQSELWGFCLRSFLLPWALVMACSVRAQAFNPDANNDGQIGAGDVIAVLAIYGLPFEGADQGPSVLHFDPDTIGMLPLGYDLYVAQDFPRAALVRALDGCAEAQRAALRALRDDLFQPGKGTTCDE